MTTWIADTVRDSNHRLYSRANAGEVMPDPITPLASTLVWVGGFAPGWRQAFVEMGVADLGEFELDRPNHFGVFGGYLFLNMSWARMIGVRGPGMTPEMIDQQYYGEMPGIPTYASEARPGDESSSHTERMIAFFGALVGSQDLAGPDEDRADLDSLAAARPDLTTLTGPALVARARDLNALGPRLFCRHVIHSVGAGVGWAMVGGVCAAMGHPELTLEVVGVTDDLDSAGPAHSLWDLARAVRASAELTAAFDAGTAGLPDRLAGLTGPDADALRDGLAAFIAKFGLRGPNELELCAATWDSSPRLVLAAIDRLRLAGDDKSPLLAAGFANARAAAARTEVDALIAGDAELAGTLAAGIRCAALYDAGRERTKTNLVKMLHEMRLVFRELGRRAVDSGDLESPDLVFMLTDSELDDFVASPSEFKAVLPEREDIYRGLFTLQPPFLMVTDAIPTIDSLPPRQRKTEVSAPGTVLTGIAGSAGAATGRARVITDPGDPRGLEPGDILVATITSPAWTPLFMTAGAVVVEVGALVSHAVIVSRELGIPCVVSIGDATTRIPDGALLAVDGSRGTVTILEP